MFGRKKKQEETDNVSMTEQFTGEDEDFPPLVSGEVVRRGLQQTQPLFKQQGFNQPKQFTQQITQPMQQQRPEAIIIEARISDSGEHYYVVKTNYPLSLGFCNLTQ